MSSSNEGAATRETDGQLLARLGTDAALWAAEMVERIPELTLDPTPGDILHGWFCNAIEAGRAAGYGAAQRQHNPDWPAAADPSSLPARTNPSEDVK